VPHPVSRIGNKSGGQKARAADHAAPIVRSGVATDSCRSGPSRLRGCRAVTASSRVKWGSERTWHLSRRYVIPENPGLFGGAEGIRTPGPLDANEVRYRTAPQPPTSPEGYQPADRPPPGRSGIAPATGARQPWTAPSHCPARSRTARSHRPARSRTARSHRPAH
jgi:hypothetical protein